MFLPSENAKRLTWHAETATRRVRKLRIVSSVAYFIASKAWFPLIFLKTGNIGHNMMRDKKKHRVLAVKEFQDKDYEDVIKRPVFCSKQGHQKEELKYYCKECETALCQTCFALDHGAHVLKLIEEEAESQKLEINTVFQKKREGLNAKNERACPTRRGPR